MTGILASVLFGFVCLLAPVGMGYEIYCRYHERPVEELEKMVRVQKMFDGQYHFSLPLSTSEFGSNALRALHKRIDRWVEEENREILAVHSHPKQFYFTILTRKRQS